MNVSFLSTDFFSTLICIMDTNNSPVVSADGDMATCPYNAAHQVSRLRLPIHLRKCRKVCPDRMNLMDSFYYVNIIIIIQRGWHCKAGIG